MKKMLLAMTVALGSSALPANAETVCSAKDNTARILSTPNANDVHPDWRGESYVGLGQSFVVRKSRKTNVGLFLQGNLLSTRGGVMNKNVWIIAREWNCQKT